MKPPPLRTLPRTRISLALAAAFAATVATVVLPAGPALAQTQTITGGSFSYADGTVIEVNQSSSNAYAVRATSDVDINAEGTLTLTAKSDTLAQTVNNVSPGTAITFTGDTVNLNAIHTDNASAANNAVGIYSFGGGPITFNNAKTVLNVTNNQNGATVTANDQTQGITLSGAASSVTVNGDLDMNVNAGANTTGIAVGAFIRSRGTATFNGNTTIDVINNSTRTDVNTGTKMSIGVNLEQSGSARAIFAGDETAITATVNNEGDRAIGVLTAFDGNETVFSGKNATVSAITTNKATATGMEAQRADAKITVANTVENFTAISSANTLIGTADATRPDIPLLGPIDVPDTVSPDTPPVTAAAVTGATANGLQASYSGKIAIAAKNTTVTASATDNRSGAAAVAALRAYRAYADLSPALSKDAAEITITGQTANLTASSNLGATTVYAGGGNITINTGNTTIEASGGTAEQQYALYATKASSYAGSTILVNSDSAGNSQGGILTLKGKLYANGNDSVIKANLDGAASSLTGSAILQNDGAIDLGVTSSARWNMTGDSHVSTLYGADNGVINLAYQPSAFQTLTIDRLESGGGNGALFHLKANIDADTADTVKIGNATGNHAILVASTGAEPSRLRMNTYLVETETGDASFSLANRGRLVDAGVYVYDLHSEENAATGTGTGWYLHRYDKDIPDPEPPKPPLSPTAEAVVTLSGVASSYSMWHSQLADLRKRMGEVRLDSAPDGVWFRTFAQKDKLDGLSGTRFSQDVYGASIGYDRRIKADERNQWLFGVKGQYTKADQDVDGTWGGSGKNESFGLAAYATWTHADGWYADGILSWDRYRQKIEDHMLDGTPVSGTFNRYGAGASVEAGRFFSLYDGFFIEPQVQLAYFWLKGKNFDMDNAMTVKTKNADVVSGRAGLVAGKSWEISKNRYIKPYLKGGIIHEFTGNDKTVINAVHDFDGDIAGTRGYYGAGLDWKFNESGRLYAEIERQDGSHIRSLWNASVGLRVSF